MLRRLMKYNIYDTKALVLKSFPYKEDGLTVLLLTREFGCLYARAQGARKQSSKLRFALTDSSYVSVGLLAGKGGWRITYLVPHKNIIFSLRGQTSSQSSVSKIMFVCARLIGEGEESKEVFDSVLNGFLKMTSDLKESQKRYDIERFIMLRVLYILGYIEHVSYLRFMSKEEYIFKESNSNLLTLRRQMNREINKALDIAW